VPWLATEWIAGDDLGRRVAVGGPPPPAEVAALVADVGAALAQLHAAGALHGDLRPRSILSTATTVKLVGAGRGLLRDVDAERPIANPLWCAPERLRNSPPTPASDVWSLGLLAFFLATGRSYWRTGGERPARAMSLLREMLIEPLPPASARARAMGATVRLPLAFDLWFARCVAREPSARFTDATAMQAELTAAMRALAQAPSSTPPPEPSPSSSEPPPMSPRWLRALAASAAITYRGGGSALAAS
jgi:serine/threonine-protein kinase